MKEGISRRAVIKGVLVGGAAVSGIARDRRAGRRPTAARSELAAGHDARVHQRCVPRGRRRNPNYASGQTCANCQQYQGKAGEGPRGLRAVSGRDGAGRGLVQGVAQAGLSTAGAHGRRGGLPAP